MQKKIKILHKENNQVCLFEEMTNTSALSEKTTPLTTYVSFVGPIGDYKPNTTLLCLVFVDVTFQKKKLKPGFSTF